MLQIQTRKASHWKAYLVEIIVFCIGTIAGHWAYMKQQSKCKHHYEIKIIKKKQQNLCQIHPKNDTTKKNKNDTIDI